MSNKPKGFLFMKKVLSIVLIIATVLTVFCGCSSKPVQSGDYEYVVLDDDTAKITKYLGTADIIELEIPTAIDDYTVTVIGKEAFKDVQCITVVTTPDTLTKIEEYAFANSSLKKIFMHRSPLLTEIGAYAFSECKNLIQADMPMDLVTLGDYAFYYCDKLKIAQFRGDPEHIGTFAFDACPKVRLYVKDNAQRTKNYADQYRLETKITDSTGK
ncbi:MAG: leucine-rich repeat domain-containing protein [Ruminococcaceae bacterium]|nr:leucine-rich repeat domain-containing protein [Oscillospiraceae bacterium]